jgi:NAD+ synthase
MPLDSNKQNTELSDAHAEFLKKKYPNVVHYDIDLSEPYHKLISTIGLNTAPSGFTTNRTLITDNLTNANTKSRMRMVTLYQIAGVVKGIVVGTGNKVEDYGVGFYTKYGDGGVDISPIADLMKSEVYDISKKLNIIDEIIDASPTDGLWSDGRTDEDQLGVNYDELEWAMKYCKKNNINSIVADSEINSLSDDKLKILRVYLKYRNANLHKMLEIPVFKK